MIITDTHVYFYGGILSNWYKCAKFKVGSYEFITSEQLFMYYKAIFFEDYETLVKITREGQDPDIAKKLGRLVKNFDAQKWDDVKFFFMLKAIQKKFDNFPELKATLKTLAEKREIVECSPTDKIWGIGLGLDNPDIKDKTKWQGQNLLGKALKLYTELYKYP